MKENHRNISPIGSDFDKHLDLELKDRDAAAVFLNEAIESHDSNYLKVALARVVRIHGFTQIAQIAGVKRESMYKMLSEDGNPGFSNIIEILDAIGLELLVKPKGHLIVRDHIVKKKLVAGLKTRTKKIAAKKW